MLDSIQSIFESPEIKSIEDEIDEIGSTNLSASQIANFGDRYISTLRSLLPFEEGTQIKASIVKFSFTWDCQVEVIKIHLSLTESSYVEVKTEENKTYKIGLGQIKMILN